MLAASLATAGTAAPAAPGLIPNCRFGVTVTRSLDKVDLAGLGVGAYLDWQQSTATTISGVDFVHVVRLRGADHQFVYDDPGSEGSARFEQALRAAVAGARGGAWLVGNEPDTTFENQDALTPDQYARAYRAVYRVIKSEDASAQVGIGTIVQPTPLRLQWLAAMLASYQSRYRTLPPSDFWSIHSFILREKAGDWGTGIPTGLTAGAGELYSLDQTNSVDIFSARLVAFRQWLADHGQRSKPLWVTEYGSLLPHDGRTGLVTQTPEQARDYMIGTFRFLSSAVDARTGYPQDGNRLVQRWFWYSLDDAPWHFGGSLYDPATGARTVIGDAFAAYLQAAEARPQLDLAAPSTGAVGAWPRQPGDPVLLQALVSNSGSAFAGGPLTVTWYAGDPALGGIALAGASVSAGLEGCGSVRLIRAWAPFPGAAREGLYGQLQAPGLSAPVVVLLGDLSLRHGPP